MLREAVRLVFMTISFSTYAPSFGDLCRGVLRAHLVERGGRSSDELAASPAGIDR
jgi:hypothetical protein